MKIYNEEKTTELKNYELTKGYLKADKLFVAHHEAVEAKDAVYRDREVVEESGGVSIYKDLVTPAVEAKDAYDEYEDIQVYIPYTAEELEARELKRLRAQRETECFPVINRGKLWYNKLTAEQETQLNDWYEAWLNVTETKTVPEKPQWIDESLNGEVIL